MRIKGKQYLCFVIGAFIGACGISMITEAALGTSPVSSLPLVLSYWTGLSFGLFTFLNNLVMFFAELAIWGRNFKKIQLLQLPATLLFSVFIDLSGYVLRQIPLPNYFCHILMLICGAITLGFGISLQVISDSLMLPADGISLVIANKINKKFSIVKTIYDFSMVGMAAIFSLIVFHSIRGIREGTLITALCVGTISHFFCRHLRPIIFPKTIK